MATVVKLAQSKSFRKNLPHLFFKHVKGEKEGVILRWGLPHFRRKSSGVGETFLGMKSEDLFYPLSIPAYLEQEVLFVSTSHRV